MRDEISRDTVSRDVQRSMDVQANIITIFYTLISELIGVKSYSKVPKTSYRELLKIIALLNYKKNKSMAELKFKSG